MPRISKPIDGSRSPLHALGAAVRDLRHGRWISQEDLGRRARLHRNYIGAIERGEINPTFRTLLRVVDGLGVSLPELIERYEAKAAQMRPRRAR
ncbi:MAG TPA: helix-turn-helix transcriptional regulator [Conexibacter sp.]|nr:helix-turn-helix transcriptional regulator [Conexibacter sp.]